MKKTKEEKMLAHRAYQEKQDELNEKRIKKWGYWGEKEEEYVKKLSINDQKKYLRNHNYLWGPWKDKQWLLKKGRRTHKKCTCTNKNKFDEIGKTHGKAKCWSCN